MAERKVGDMVKFNLFGRITDAKIIAIVDTPTGKKFQLEMVLNQGTDKEIKVNYGGAREIDLVRET